MSNYRLLIESMFSLPENSQSNSKIIQSFIVKDELCPEIFEIKKEHLMKDSIRNGLLDISQDFIDSCGIEFSIEDIILTGSLANYNWSDYSDVDLHILVNYDDLKDKEVMEELFDAKKVVWNESHDVKIKGFDVEMYVQDSNEIHTASGIYSVLNHEWIVKPKKTNPMIDKSKIMEKANEYIQKIDRLIQLSKKQNVLPQIKNLKDKIRKLRSAGLQKEGEFSYENLVYKLLRRNGYIEKLIDLKKEMVDKKLSIKEVEIVDMSKANQPETGGKTIGIVYDAQHNRM